MRRIASFLVLSFACLPLSQAADAPAKVDPREAARCGGHFRVLGSGATGDMLKAYEAASALFFQYALAEAPQSQVSLWLEEFQQDFPDRSKGAEAFSTFLSANQKKCSPLAMQIMQGGSSKPSADAKANRISKRHASNRPSEAAVFGETAIYSDVAGDSCQAPVVETGVTRRDSRIRAQYMWLDDQRPKWKVTSHATKYSGPVNAEKDLDSVLIYSEFAMTDEKGAAQTVCFDVTESMKPELRELAKK